MKKKVLFFIAIGVLSFLMVLGVGTVVVLNTPKMVIARTFNNVAKEVVKRDEIKPIVKVLKQGSIQALYEDEEIDMKVGGKVYFSNEALMISNVEVKSGENEILGELYVSKDEVYVSEDNILDGAYGFKFENLKEDLEESILAPDSDSYYALDEEIFDQIISTLDLYEEQEAMSKDFAKVVEKVYNKVSKIVLNNAEITKESDEIRINGKKEKVRVIEIAIDDEAMQTILEEVYDYLCDTKDITRFLEKYEETLNKLLVMNGFDEDFSILDEYEDALDELEDVIDDVIDGLEDAETVKIIMATPKMRATLAQLQVKVGKEEVLTLDIGTKGIKNTNQISLENPDGEKITYTVSENNRKSFKSEVSVTNSYSEDEVEVSVEINKERGNYTVSVDQISEKSDYWYGYDYTYTYSTMVKGDFATKGDTTTITIDKVVEVESEDYPEGYDDLDSSEEWENEMGSIEFVFDTKDKMPKPRSYSSIAEIYEEDIEEWEAKFEDLF